MANAVNVKWPGQHIADDSTHRLVTDTQIERWDKSVIDYTDLIVTEDTNIDTLQDGKYKIKFGLDSYIFDYIPSKVAADQYPYPENFVLFARYTLSPNYENIINQLQMSSLIDDIYKANFHTNYHGNMYCYSGAIIQNIFIDINNNYREILLQIIVYDNVMLMNNDTKELYICDLNSDGIRIYEYNIVQHKMYLMGHPYFDAPYVLTGECEEIWSIPKIKHDPLHIDTTSLVIYANGIEYTYHPNMHSRVGGTYTIDLSSISSKSRSTSNWNSATKNGEYSSKIGATNAPTSTIAYMGSVLRGKTSITQKLYADTDDLTAVSEYIRRGNITVDSDDNETITWGNWYYVDYAIPSAE